MVLDDAREIVTPDMEPLVEVKSFAPKKAPQDRQPLREQRKKRKPENIVTEMEIEHPIPVPTKHSRPPIKLSMSNVVNIEPPSPEKAKPSKVISKKPTPTFEQFEQPVKQERLVSFTTSNTEDTADKNLRKEVDRIIGQDNVNSDTMRRNCLTGNVPMRLVNNSDSEKEFLQFKMPNTESLKRRSSSGRKLKRASNTGRGRIQDMLNETIEEIREYGKDYKFVELVFESFSDDVIEEELRLLEQTKKDVALAIGHRQEYKIGTKSFARDRMTEWLQRGAEDDKKRREERRKQRLNQFIDQARNNMA